MINLVKSQVGDKFYISGTVNGQPYGVTYAEGLWASLVEINEEVEVQQRLYKYLKETHADKILADYRFKMGDNASEATVVTSIPKPETVKKAIIDAVTRYEGLIESATGPGYVLNHPNIHYNQDYNTWHIKAGSVISKKAIPKRIIAKIQESVEKGLDPLPYLKHWMRFLRNVNYSSLLAERLAEYITTTVQLPELYAKAIEAGYTPQMAQSLSNVPDCSVTTEGLLATYKVVTDITPERMKEYDWDYQSRKAAQGGGIPKTRSYVDGPDEDEEDDQGYDEDEDEDDNNGIELVPNRSYYSGAKQITEAEISVFQASIMAEDKVYEPCQQGRNGDAFWCGADKGHIIRVGQRHRLDSWSMVNTDLHTTCVPGLHVGGLRYIQGYKNRFTSTLNVFLDPAEIGAITNGTNSFAIRMREYYVYSINASRDEPLNTPNRALFFSSHYSQIMDSVWNITLQQTIRESNQLRANFNENL